MYLARKCSIKSCVHFAILAASAMVLSACNLTAPAAKDPVTNANTPVISKSNPLDDYDGCQGVPPAANVEHACQKQHGIMQKAGRMGCYQCIVSYSDAGKSCQDSADCQGDCRVKPDEFLPNSAVHRTGVCAKDSNPFGCYQTIKNGVPQSALCVD